MICPWLHKPFSPTSQLPAPCRGIFHKSAFPLTPNLKYLWWLLPLPMPVSENDTSCQMYRCSWALLMQDPATGEKKVGINYACVSLVLGWTASSAEAVLAATGPWEVVADKLRDPLWCDNPLLPILPIGIVIQRVGPAFWLHCMARRHEWVWAELTPGSNAKLCLLLPDV